MKNIKILAILSMVIVLSACGAKDTTKEYVSTQTKLLAASEGADADLVATLQKAKDGKVPFSDLEAMIKTNRDLQQGIYNSLSATNTPKNSTSANEGSLLSVGEKITSYNAMIKTLSVQNYDILAQSVKSHQTLTIQYTKNAIEKINTSLTAAGEPTIDAFTAKEAKK